MAGTQGPCKVGPPCIRFARSVLHVSDSPGRSSMYPIRQVGPPCIRFARPSWGHFGPSWNHLGAIFGHYGSVLAHLGAILSQLGVWSGVCEYIGAILGPSWIHLGVIRGILLASWHFVFRGPRPIDLFSIWTRTVFLIPGRPFKRPLKGLLKGL